MQSGKLQNALKNLGAAIKEVGDVIEEIHAEKDPAPISSGFRLEDKEPGFAAPGADIDDGRMR